MACEMSPIYKSLVGNPIFLPLSFVMNTLAFMSSAEMAGCERWRALELMRWMVMHVFDCVVSLAHTLCVHIPNQVPAHLSKKIISMGLYLPVGKEEDCTSITAPQELDSGIGRALCQVLALVNDTAVSSEKYEFARNLADKIVQQNMAQGDAILREANKAALSAGFTRTLNLLVLALEGLKQQQEGRGSSSWTLIHSIFLKALGISQYGFSLETIRICMSNFLYPVLNSAWFSKNLPLQRAVANAGSATDSLLAEKLAQELLWMTEKLKECVALDEAIVKWGTLSCLASLSLSAHPRVQASLLRVSVLVFKELVSEAVKSRRSLTMNLLLLWLPLFCHAKSGFDCPMFSSSEKVDILGVLEENILSLSYTEQEVVLGCWLREYVSSSSEWPNLQQCFETWCHASRKATKALL